MDLSLFQKMFQAKSQVSRPKCADILHKASIDYEQLLKLKEGLSYQGLMDEDLPDNKTLLAFAYLQDYARNEQVNRLTIEPSKLKQLIGEKDLGLVTTPELRLLNTVSEALESLVPLEQRFASIDLDELETLSQSEFFSVDQIAQPYWSGRRQIRAEISDDIQHLYFRFGGLAKQQSHLYTLKSKKRHTFLSSPFTVDDGVLNVLAKIGDAIKVKTIHMTITNEVENNGEFFFN